MTIDGDSRRVELAANQGFIQIELTAGGRPLADAGIVPEHFVVSMDTTSRFGALGWPVAANGRIAGPVPANVTAWMSIRCTRAGIEAGCPFPNPHRSQTLGRWVELP